MQSLLDAAARVRVLSVDQLAERLADRFGLLTGGSRAALPRQQTLRAALDWSHDLLSASEQALLRPPHVRRLLDHAGHRLDDRLHVDTVHLALAMGGSGGADKAQDVPAPG